MSGGIFQAHRRARTRSGAATAAQAGVAATSYELSPLLVALERSGPHANAIGEFGAKIVTHHIAAGHRGLAMCGASAGIGVTFLASNLAVAIAQLGPSVLLVDANLSDPGVTTYFRPTSPASGLTDALERDDRPGAAYIHRDVLPNLSILYAGARRQDGSDLLQQDRFAQLIESAMRNFDCTLVDCPPANRAVGARRAATLTGYALIVSRRGVTYANDVSTLTEELKSDGVQVIGSILNG